MGGVVKYSEFEKVVFLRSSLDENIPYVSSYTSDPKDFIIWMDTIEHDVELVYGLGKHNLTLAEKTFSDIDRLQSYLNKFKKEAFHASNMIDSELNTLLETLKLLESSKDYLLGERDSKPGRRPIPSLIANQLLKGLDLSKKDYRSYEPFRLYLHHADENDFNLNKRKELGKLQTSSCDSFDHFNIKKYLNFQFPSVPAKERKETSWARALRQSLKAAVENDHPFM